MFIRHEFWSFLIVSVLIIACKSQDSETYNACVETVEMARDRDQGNVQGKCTTTWFMSFCGFQQALFFVFTRPAEVAGMPLESSWLQSSQTSVICEMKAGA